jgi:Holliday junction resolvase RusA-like endonuclease
VRALGVTLPEHPHVTFHIPMPKSWPLKKQNDMIGQPHRQTPDVDNLFKALADAVYASDSHIWDARMTKFWSISGFILVEEQVGK